MLVAIPTAMPLVQPVVEVGLKIDGIPLDVLQHGHGHARQPGFGIAVGRRRIAIYRAKVSLAIHQGIAKREFLDHPDQRIVD